MESLDTYAAANLLSMRPGANAGINRSGNSNLAPDCGLAAMRPGAKRRDHLAESTYEYTERSQLQ